MPKTVMIVEDEMLIGLAMEQTLLAKGYEVAGPFVSQEEAVEYLEENRPDAALLDVNLGHDQNSFAIAEIVMESNIPFAFLSGYAANANSFDGPVANVPRISKPCTNDKLAAEVKGLVG